MTSNDPSTPEPRFGDQVDPDSFERFTRRLIGLARTHLHLRLLNKVDPEDVVQSAYKSFVLRYGDDAFDSHRLDSLWGLLSVITLRKCADRVRHYAAERRDIAREVVDGPDGTRELWRDAVDREPTPEHAAALAEVVERLLSDLTPPERPIVELSLQGFSTREVSEKLGRAERSVRRVRERVRERLERI